MPITEKVLPFVNSSVIEKECFFFLMPLFMNHSTVDFIFVFVDVVSTKLYALKPSRSLFKTENSAL